MNDRFYYNESRLVAHFSGEDSAKQLASRLQNACDSLRFYSDSDLYYQCKKVSAMAEDLYRYCRSMRDALDDMHIEFRQLSRSVEDTLDQSEYNAHKLLSHLDGIEEAIATLTLD